MSETISIPKKEYEELIKYKYTSENKNKFDFNEVFALGSGKLRGQEIKDMLREEW